MKILKENLLLIGLALLLAPGIVQADDSNRLRKMLQKKNHFSIPAGKTLVIGEVDLLPGQSISGPGTIVKRSDAAYALQVVGDNVSISGVNFRPQTVWGQPNCDIKLGDGARDVKITGNHFEGLSYSAICAADDSAVGGVEYNDHATGVLVTNNPKNGS